MTVHKDEAPLCPDCKHAVRGHRRDLGDGTARCSFCDCYSGPTWYPPVDSFEDLPPGEHPAETRLLTGDLSVCFWVPGLASWERRDPIIQHSLDEIIQAYAAWRARNFDPVEPDRLLLKLMGEVGELTDAHCEERARGGTEAHTREELGDVIVYTMAYAIRRGWDWSQIIRDVWEKVRRRDYRAYPRTGDPVKEAALLG